MSVSLFPGFCNSLSQKNFRSLLVDTLAISAQVTGFVVWPLMSGDVQLWLIPVSVILISARWWENYASEQSFFGESVYEYADNFGRCLPARVINLPFASVSFFPQCLNQTSRRSRFLIPVPLRWMVRLKTNLIRSRYFIYLYLSPLKVLVFLLIGILMSLDKRTFSDHFTKFSIGWRNHTVNTFSVRKPKMRFPRGRGTLI